MPNEEANTRSLYLLYGITEWPAKCNVLTNEERLQALNDLRNGTNSRLAELVKKPFPSFATEYFKDFAQAQEYFKDPAFAFKIYFLTESQLRFFSEYMRNSEITYEQIKKLIKENYGYTTAYGHIKNIVEEIRIIDLESLANTMSSIKHSRTKKIKFLQLMSYIDVDSVRSMNLSSARLFEITGETGLDLEANLNLLNPTARKILILYIGLYGFKSHSIEEISNIVFGKDMVLTTNFINFLIPKMSKSTKELAHAIGFKGASPENMFEYKAPGFKKLSIDIEVYGLIHDADEYTKAILDKMNPLEKKIYLAAKFMYKTPESLARNLNLSIATAKEKISSI